MRVVRWLIIDKLRVLNIIVVFGLSQFRIEIKTHKNRNNKRKEYKKYKNIFVVRTIFFVDGLLVKM